MRSRISIPAVPVALLALLSLLATGMVPAGVAPAAAWAVGTPMPATASIPTLPATLTGADPATVTSMPVVASVLDPRVERVSTDVTVRIDGRRRVAHFEVEEVFRNRGRRVLEGDYLYPLPDGAAFTEFSLWAGERELRGEMLPADRARAVYEEIVRRRKDPALIELVGRGLIRARVFPIEPGQSRRVALRYTQVLGRDGDLVRLRYPVATGLIDPDGPVPVPEVWEERDVGAGVQGQPRAPERGVEAGAASQRPARTGTFSLTVRLDGASEFATPYSPTHSIDIREDGEDALVIAPDTGAGGGDFELLLPLRRTGVGASLLAHAPGGEPGYFLLLLSPPEADEELRIPRDVTLVLDVSGSMSGDKIIQARAAVEQILGGLGADDRFRLITFASVVRRYQEGFRPATMRHVDDARQWLAAARAEGSTDIGAALVEALQADVDPERLGQVIFLTDGRPTLGETDPQRIVEQARSHLDGERVFAFGVGHDVNTWVLDVVTDQGRGTVTYVRPGDSVEAAVSGLARKIRHPALADLRVVEAPATLEDLQPARLPDLFLGEELVVLGRYRGEGTGDLVVEGSRSGRSETLRFEVALPAREPGNGFIPRLWASRKAGALTAQVRLHGPDPELVEEIRRLGLRYGVLTEYTSYLVEEPELAMQLSADEVARRYAREAAAPAAQSGADSFERAERSARLRASGNLAEAEEAVRKLTAGRGVAPGEAGGVAEGAVRRVGERLFVLRRGVWTDVRQAEAGPTSGVRRVKVAPLSPAWFELGRRLPALRPALALGDRVIIAGEGLVLELAPDGIERWSPGSLEEILQAFDADGLRRAP